MRNFGRIAWIALVFLSASFRVYAFDDIHLRTPAFQSHISVEPVANVQQAVVSVLDPSGAPIRDLQPQDFVFARGIHKGRVVTLEPLQPSKAPPLNLVLVIDNSFSMQERAAVRPLLIGLEELLKDIRPVDHIHAVVFNDREGRAPGGRTLNVRTFTSSQASEWKRFFSEAFDRGITNRTYLYDAVLAGMEIVKAMPPDAPKLMAVFSDGEDLNSRIKKSEVEAAGVGLKKFQSFCIDYLPGEKADPFLASLASNHRGRIWKARSASELVPVFQDFKSTIFHKHILTYELLNPIEIEPKALTFDMPITTTGAPATHMVFFATGQSVIPNAYVQFKTPGETDAFQPGNLAWKASFSQRYFNILNFVGKALRDAPRGRVGIVGCVSEYGPEKDNRALSRARAEAVKNYLQRIWGIDAARMGIEARLLPAEPSTEETPDGQKENQRVEFVFDSEATQSSVAGRVIAESANQNGVQVKLDLNPLVEVAKSEVRVQANEQTLLILKEGVATRPIHTIALDELGRNRLARLNSFDTLIRVTDRAGRVYEASSDLCHVKTRSRVLIRELSLAPYGTVQLEPEALTVEEITVVDNSPLLNHIYFDGGRADIPGRYALFKTTSETGGFDPNGLKGAMEKYRHVLNIIGQRMAERPKARLKIVGCNSGLGEEKGRFDLSRGRAEAVRDYLRSIWRIDPLRMDLESRGLPRAASAGNIPEGRSENQRVEIYADDSAIFDTVQSTFIEALSDTETFRIVTTIEPGAALKRWSLGIYGDDQRLESLTGEGGLEPSYVLALKDVGLLNIGGYKTVSAVLEAADSKGQSLKAQDASTVHFVRREERLARREGYRVFEKYALILFDFGSEEIKDGSRGVMKRIGTRLRELPSATIQIIGHTDAIGKPDANMALSRKRAEAVYEQILSGGYTERERISFEGRGSAGPLFDNGLPEGRAYNRTVTVLLQYEQK